MNLVELIDRLTVTHQPMHSFPFVSQSHLVGGLLM